MVKYAKVLLAFAAVTATAALAVSDRVQADGKPIPWTNADAVFKRLMFSPRESQNALSLALTDIQLIYDPTVSRLNVVQYTEAMLLSPPIEERSARIDRIASELRALGVEDDSMAKALLNKLRSESEGE